MKRLAFLVLMFPLTALPCTLEWDYSSDDQALIDGFQFEVNGKKANRVPRSMRQIDCRRVMVKGYNVIRLYAYKRSEYSGPSNPLEYTMGDASQSDLPAPTLHFSRDPI